MITGYNIDNFDLPRILERTEHLVGKGKDRTVWLGRVPLMRTQEELFPIVAKTEHGVSRESSYGCMVASPSDTQA